MSSQLDPDRHDTIRWLLSPTNYPMCTTWTVPFIRMNSATLSKWARLRTSIMTSSAKGFFRHFVDMYRLSPYWLQQTAIASFYNIKKMSSICSLYSRAADMMFLVIVSIRGSPRVLWSSRTRTRPVPGITSRGGKVADHKHNQPVWIHHPIMMLRPRRPIRTCLQFELSE
jgi:hypothetical protein